MQNGKLFCFRGKKVWWKIPTVGDILTNHGTTAFTISQDTNAGINPDDLCSQLI
jgi:hypothetical protein